MGLRLSPLPLPLMCLTCASCQDNFTFADFDTGSRSRLIFRGTAQLSKYGNFVDLTPSNTSAGAPNVQYNSGRVLYYRPITMWPASFTTTFTVLIANLSNYDPGDGLGFLATAGAGEPPAGSYGSLLGLFNTSTNLNTTGQLAVELDTVQNQEYDPDNNHVGIDTVGIRSNATASLTPYGIHLTSGRRIAVRISYDGWSHTLAVYAAYADRSNPTFVSVLNYSIFLSRTLPRTCYVGFSAGTGVTVEKHRLLSWQFSSEILSESSLPRRPRCGLSTAQTAALVSACTIGILTAVIAAASWMMWKKIQKQRMLSAWATALTVHYGPRPVDHKQLCAAIGNFSDAQLLGRGGFGCVYRGEFRAGAQSVTVAVKRIRPASRQAQRGFQAELTSMGRLPPPQPGSPAGLVPPRGIPAGLRIHAQRKPGQAHFRRIDGAESGSVVGAAAARAGGAGVGAAVPARGRRPARHSPRCEAEQSFPGRLGDFGLTRLATHDGSLSTVVAGTVGYVAPGCAYTGHTTAESDVFSFGIVALEVATGSGVGTEGGLVERVWRFHADGRIMEAVDERLRGEFHGEQMSRVLRLGLACCQPDPQLRPPMRQALRVLTNPGEPLSKVPASRPAYM